VGYAAHDVETEVSAVQDPGDGAADLVEPFERVSVVWACQTRSHGSTDATSLS